MTPPGVYALFIEYPQTGHITVLTFHSPFLRAIEMIALAHQPVTLRCVDYDGSEKLRMAKATLKGKVA